MAKSPDFGPAADHWNRGLPFVLCRRREGEELSLGFCLPSGSQDKPSRHAIVARWADVGMVMPPPLLRELAVSLPTLHPLRPFAHPDNPRVVGSAMWEYLTEEKFLRSDSDIDLVWDLAQGEDPVAAADFFHRADALLPGRVDGEIHFPGFGEVAWREWVSASQTLLLKSLTEVSLISRNVLLEAQKARLPRSSPLADAAVAALLEELKLYPKPGLVSRHDAGSHTDMDYSLMRKSAEALHPFFAEIESNPGDFADCLKPIGIRAEKRMLEVTGGINTHRGAIFLLGLLVAAASRARDLSPPAIQESLLAHYGTALLEHEKAIMNSMSHGATVRKSHGSAGARGEAANGFPTVFAIASPHFKKRLTQGTCRQAAALETLMLLVAHTDDSNLVHRGGAEGAMKARQAAAEFLEEGGVRACDWFQKLQVLHHRFTSARLSPGGCADLLAAVLFLNRCDS